MVFFLWILTFLDIFIFYFLSFHWRLAAFLKCVSLSLFLSVTQAQGTPKISLGRTVLELCPFIFIKFFENDFKVLFHLMGVGKENCSVFIFVIQSFKSKFSLSYILGPR
jgi:hypothetical protein